MYGLGYYDVMHLKLNETIIYFFFKVYFNKLLVIFKGLIYTRYPNDNNCLHYNICENNSDFQAFMSLFIYAILATDLGYCDSFD